jgi:hypothetical protein
MIKNTRHKIKKKIRQNNFLPRGKKKGHFWTHQRRSSDAVTELVLRCTVFTDPTTGWDGVKK